MIRSCSPLLLLVGVLCTVLTLAADPAPQPLYRDPIHDGAADPVVIWNPDREAWWMFYTNRRANVPELSGVAWVHGTRIGIAESRDRGTTWQRVGDAQIEGVPSAIAGTAPTHWAPEVITGPNGTHHMFLTMVPGIFENWQHPRRIVHLTSDDLLHWNFQSVLPLASDRVIDAGVAPRPDGGWRLWYNNERDGKSIYYADSPDLYRWQDQGKVPAVSERPGEGPCVFFWRETWWMLIDHWQGLGVYRSDDLQSWTAQEDDLLDMPGKGEDDGVNGGHPGVVVSGDRIFLFYFTHPGRAGTISPDDPDSLDRRRSSIQVSELKLADDGQLTCDRNTPTFIDLHPAPSTDAAVGNNADRTIHPVDLAPNPLIHQRADPHIHRHTDGTYYYMGTVPAYDRLELRRASSLVGLADATPQVIWEKHATGPMGDHIWAPEIHHLDGKWYVYFAAGDAENRWHLRIYVLVNPSPDPFTGTWTELGPIDTGWDNFALDATVFQHRGMRYLLWAQKGTGDHANSNLYIAPLATPTTLAGPAVLLSEPEFDWEKVRYQVNEGPVILRGPDRLFLTYSASGTGPEYCVGMLTAPIDADPLDPTAWIKYPEPVFASNPSNRIFGPGHHSFTKAEDGVTDVIVYHARDYAEIEGDPLRDPNRHTRIQTVRWQSDGTPDFGIPRPNTPALSSP